MSEREILAEFVVVEPPEPDFFDSFAAIALKDCLPSRKAATKAICRGDLVLDGKKVAPNERVKMGQILTLFAKKTENFLQLKLPLEVVYEDEFLAVVNKPPGIQVDRSRPRCIENALEFNLKASNSADKLEHMTAVHRLDAPTSGLLLIAKTAEALRNLTSQFKEGQTHKKYLTIVAGKIDEKGHVSTEIDGKNALTEYEPLQVTPSGNFGFITTVQVTLHTGRTHQIRKHMALIGHPVIGDRQYGGQFEKMPTKKGLFLCSCELGIRHPESEENLRFTLKEPEKFETLRRKEKRRCTAK